MDLPGWLVDAPWIVVIVTTVGIYASIIVFARLNGLRSFSAMSGFDFVMTVALGSLVATTILDPQRSLLAGMIGLAGLFVLQRLVSTGRRRGRTFKSFVDNEPLLLMRNGEVLHKNLDKARVAKEDLDANLRANGVLRYADVEAVVMETTGVVSVMKRQEGVKMDEGLLGDVRS